MKRMKEVELSLRNVKLLLREKDAHLKEQVSSTGYTGTERVNGVVFPVVFVCAYMLLYICSRVTDSSDYSSGRKTGKQTC